MVYISCTYIPMIILETQQIRTTLFYIQNSEHEYNILVFNGNPGHSTCTRKIRAAKKLRFCVSELKKTIKKARYWQNDILSKYVKIYVTRTCAGTKQILWLVLENSVIDLRIRLYMGSSEVHEREIMEMGFVPWSWLRRLFCNMEHKKLRMNVTLLTSWEQLTRARFQSDFPSLHGTREMPIWTENWRKNALCSKWIREPMRIFFPIYLIPSSALGPGDHSYSNINEYEKNKNNNVSGEQRAAGV
jgi:hypothetical protein